MAAAAASAAILAGGVHGHDDQKVLKEESSSSTVAEPSSKPIPQLPTFTVSFPVLSLLDAAPALSGAPTTAR